MSDTVFRSAQNTTSETTKDPEVVPATSSGDETQVEIPYLDYEQTHPAPYLVEYFHLGDTWNDPQGGFPREIEGMSKFIENRIKNGDIANSQAAVKQLLKEMEKVNNISREERAVIKIEVLKNYMEFLTKNEDVKRNVRIYGNS